MSVKHPIIAVTGSSGAQRDRVRNAFDALFRKEGFRAAYVDGDCFHRYNRCEMRDMLARKAAEGERDFSHFGAEANLFDRQEQLYRDYGENGTGQRRYYIHTDDEAEAYAQQSVKPGQLTPWEDLPEGTDCLLYEGLHGWVKTSDVDLTPYVDLKIGVVPVINLEWTQKILKDTKTRGYSEEAVVDTILRRMPDYVRYVVPQFRRSDINFQRVPVVDTSNPFVAREVPLEDESVVVVRFNRPEKFGIDFPYLLRNIEGSWMSRRNSIVVPGGRMTLTIQLVLTPIITRLMENASSE